MTNSRLPAILLCVLLLPAFSMAQGWQWAAGSICYPNNGAIEDVYKSVVDSKGNIFTGTLTYNVEYCVFGKDTVFSHSAMQTMIISKMDSSGHFVWAQGFNCDYLLPIDLAVDTMGNLYVFGAYQPGTLSIGGITLVNPFPTSAISFLVKFDPGGHVVFAKNMVQAVSDVAAYYYGGMAIDDTGNIYVTCAFDSTITFGTTQLPCAGRVNFFVAKLTSSAAPIWAERIGGAGADYSIGIVLTPGGNLYVAGESDSASVTIGGNILHKPGSFLFKLNNNGSPIWAEDIAPVYTLKFTTDSMENIFIAGGFADSAIQLGAYTIVNSDFQQVASNKRQSSFVARLDSSGSVTWAVPKSGAGISFTTWGIGLDPCENPWICGGKNFQGGVPRPVDTLFISEFSSSGKALAAAGLPSGGDDWSDILFDKKGNFYFAGDYISPVPFVVGTTTLPQNNTSEYMFVAKYQYFRPGTAYTHTDTDICSSGPYVLTAPPGYTNYEWSDGKTGLNDTVATGGTYVATCSTSGCPGIMQAIDSFHVVTADLSFSLGADTFACSSVLLSVPGNGATYRWQDGSMGTSYTATETGQYYCTASKQGCAFADTISVTIPAISQHLSDTTICAEFFDHYYLLANVPPGATCTWSTGATTPAINVTAQGIYSVTVKDSVCSASASARLTIADCGIVIHDVFTPNGDGINDTWIIEGIDKYPNNVVQLFDKWGNLLYQKPGYNNRWSGKADNGNLLPDGTYFYVVQLNAAKVIAGEKNTYTGSVLIKR